MTKPRMAWPGMTEANLQVYVTEMAEALGLDHWLIDVSGLPADDNDVKAHVWKRDGHYEARVAVAEEWSTFSPEAQRETVIHELLHLVLGWPRHATYDGLEKLLPTYLLDAVWSPFMDAEEHSISLLARALAPLFPLPT